MQFSTFVPGNSTKFSLIKLELSGQNYLFSLLDRHSNDVKNSVIFQNFLNFNNNNNKSIVYTQQFLMALTKVSFTI